MPLTTTPDRHGSEPVRRVGAALFRRVRQDFRDHPVADRIMAETLPASIARDGQEIIGAGRGHGRRGHHEVATCPAGLAGDDLVDLRLCVHGIAGLRIVDRSALRATLFRNLNRRSRPWPESPPAPPWTRADPAPAL
ncbi:GMC oxidoreductase [Streptomyces sp. NBC_01261]